MESRRSGVLCLLISVVLVACEGPFLNLPGGALAGTPAPVPDSWAFTDEVSTIKLETNPAEPYSVNIWVVALDDFLYVHAGDNRAEWVANMEADPNVRLQVDDAVYALEAARVTDQAEFERFAAAYADKYFGRPGNEDVAEAYLFRLGAR